MQGFAPSPTKIPMDSILLYRIPFLVHYFSYVLPLLSITITSNNWNTIVASWNGVRCACTNHTVCDRISLVHFNLLFGLVPFYMSCMMLIVIHAALPSNFKRWVDIFPHFLSINSFFFGYTHFSRKIAYITVHSDIVRNIRKREKSIFYCTPMDRPDRVFKHLTERKICA